MGINSASSAQKGFASNPPSPAHCAAKYDPRPEFAPSCSSSMDEFPAKKKCGSSTINSCKSTDIFEVRDVVSRSSITLSASGSVM